MNRAEIETALAGMVVLVDTREQNTAAFRERVRHFGAWEREKLDAGDYSAKIPLPEGDWIRIRAAVERKMDFDELAMCYTRQRARFKREFERAQEAGLKIYLLIEEGSWEAAYAGLYQSKMSSQAFVASLLAWLARYNCQVIFCKRKTSGQLIRDILFRESKETLMRMVEDG